MHYASTEKLAELLLQHGADPKAVDQWGKTPLHYASKEATVDLIKRGANVNAVDNLVNTPLHFSSYSPEVAVTLLNNGAKYSKKIKKDKLLRILPIATYSMRKMKKYMSQVLGV